MKFAQLVAARWSDKETRRFGYTLFALGEDGQVYKSAVGWKNRHLGWIPLSEQILSANFEDTQRHAREISEQKASEQQKLDGQR